MGSLGGRKHINLQLGWPTPSLFPNEALAAASQDTLLNYKVAAEALIYGPDPGHGALRRAAASWLNEFYGTGGTSPESLFITNGASGALSMLLTAFTDPGYTRHIWMVEPTYFLACKIFEDAGFSGRLRGVPEGDDGIDIDFLRKGLLAAEDDFPANQPGSSGTTVNARVYRHVIYAVPTFSNPSGKVWSQHRRRQLVKLAREFDALIICDDVYDWLRWPATETDRADTELPPPPPRLVDVDRALPGGTEWGNAVSNGSFSKIVAPGVRVGWVDSSPSVATELCRLGLVKSGGSQAHLTSMIISSLLTSGALGRHIRETLIPTYRRRYHVMLKAIEKQLLPLGITSAPLGDGEEKGGSSPAVAGGFFIWLDFPQTSAMAERVAKLALENYDLRVAHGGMMSVAGDGECTKRAERGFGMGVRLCWAWHSEDEIEQGVERLAVAFEEAQSK